MPGLLRGMARTAVIAGTATHVSNNVSRRQARRWNQQAEAEQYETAQVQPAPVDDTDAQIEQLQKLAELQKAGILTPEEFAQKETADTWPVIWLNSTVNQVKPTIPVASGRVAGLYYPGKSSKGSLLVLFNQWRSGANSILSKYIANFVLESDLYSGVLFIDRIASGGASDNMLTKEEKKNMPHLGESQFGIIYAEAIVAIVKEHRLPSSIVFGGSSAGAPAALAAAAGTVAINHEIAGVVLVEPSGLKKHGIKGYAAIPHALSKHLIAYRHRISRGWWTPMDKEQYFAKGKMFEYRAKYFAGDGVYGLLTEALADSSFPQLTVIISKDSHIHSSSIRSKLKQAVVAPHRIVEVTGNHDRICQPPSLSKFYLNSV